MPRLALLLLMLALQSPAAHASDAAARCVGIDDDRARLACYDAAHGREPKSNLAAPVATAGPAVAPSPEKATQNFGHSAEKIVGPQEGPAEITAGVTAVQANDVTGKAVIELDNGQLWQQVEAARATKRPRPGDRVTIRKASLDSYLMLTPGRGSIRVRRLR